MRTSPVLFSIRKCILPLLVVAFFITATPVPVAQAAGLTDGQIQSILSLLQSFGASQDVINNVNAALHGLPVSSNGNSSSCLDLSYDLYGGQIDPNTNGEVSKLQQFLGISPTGYFGPLTEQAVQQWQSSHGVVSSGTPDTTGYGYVGPKTRAAMGCGKSVTPYATIDQSSLTTTSGTPVITGSASGVSSVFVRISGNNQGGNSQGVVSVVNGRWNSGVIYADLANPANTPFSPGTYSVSVSNGPTSQVLSTGTLTVTGSNSTQQTNPVVINSFTASPSTVTAGQPVTFSWSSNLTQNDISQNGGGCYIYSNIVNNGSINLNGDDYGASGTFAYTPSASATYTLHCYSGGKDGSPEAQESLQVGSNSINPSATIDQSSLTATALPPVLSGTAQDTQDVTISIWNGHKVYGSGSIPVVNGRWSAAILSDKVGLPNGILINGTYTVSVYGDSNNLLTTGILTVAVSQTSTTPTVALIPLPTQTLTNGSVSLLRFSITANPSGPIGVGRFSFGFATSSYTGTNTTYTLYGYTDPTYSLPMAGTWAAGGQISSANIALFSPVFHMGGAVRNSPPEIPAGVTYYFDLRATVSNVQPGSTITTTLLGDQMPITPSDLVTNYPTLGNFRWSPNTNGPSASTTSDWLNAYGVPGLPSSGLTQTVSAVYSGVKGYIPDNRASQTAAVIESLQIQLQQIEQELQQLLGI